MIPLDGGFLFNDALGSLVKRLKKDSPEEIRNKIAHCRILSNDDLAKLELFHKEIIEAILRVG